jgi:hypothetical protein
MSNQAITAMAAKTVSKPKAALKTAAFRNFLRVSSRLAPFAFFCVSAGASDVPSQLRALLPAQNTTLLAVPLDAFGTLDFTLQRFEPYAPGARIVEVTKDGAHDLPRSNMRFYLGAATAAEARIALSSDADGNNLRGTLSTRGENFELKWVNGAWQSVNTKSILSPGLNPTFQCGNTPQISALEPKRLVPGRESIGVDILDPKGAHEVIATIDAALRNSAGPDLKNTNATLATRTATVAFDIDAAAITKKFAGSNTNATNYLPTLITGMNTSYDSPLNVQLLLGTTFIRTSGADPYAGITSTQTQLDRLAIQWRDNHPSVQRAFVMLISAAQASGCSASGLAWVDAYCRNGSAGSTNVYGSYSANQLFHSECSAVSIDNDLRIMAHELGHNFGASHTHCTNSGGFIDACFNGEAGCYSGAQSCPAGGGTLMSYCHLLGGCSTSLLFHPVHVSIINPKTAAAFTAGCLKPAGAGLELILRDGFE